MYIVNCCRKKIDPNEFNRQLLDYLLKGKLSDGRRG